MTLRGERGFPRRRRSGLLIPHAFEPVVHRAPRAARELRRVAASVGTIHTRACARRDVDGRDDAPEVVLTIERGAVPHDAVVNNVIAPRDGDHMTAVCARTLADLTSAVLRRDHVL